MSANNRKNLFLLPALLAGLELILASRVTAQSAGYLWLDSNVNSTEDTFEKINPSTGALVQTITHYSVGAPLPLGGEFAYGGGYLWLFSNVNSTEDTFEAINPSTGALVQTITHYSVGAPLPHGGQFAYGGGYLWLFSNVNSTEDTFEKINPSTGALVQTITHYSVGAPLPLGGEFAYGGGYLWLFSNVNSTEDTFEAINPSTGALVQTITHYSVGAPLPHGGQFAYGGGYLWLFSNVNSTEDTFEKINPSTGALVQTITHYSVGAPLPLGGEFGVESQWSLTLASSPNNAGTVIGAGTYDDWTTTTVVATPSSCYSFVNWTVGGTVVSTSPSYSLTVTASQSLTANFTPITYIITTSASPSGCGTISGGGTVNCGTSVTLIATANPCYTFVNWTVGGTVVGTSPSYTFTASSNETLVANFALNTCTISTSSSPPIGGITAGGGTVSCGSSVTVTAITNSGYSFVNWTAAGNVISSSRVYTFTASTNQALVANFAIIPLVVTNLQPSPSGVSVFFNRAINASVLSLYGSNVSACFTMIGSTSGPVAGSLIIGAQATSATFVKTGGPLAADTYTVTLLSATNGFKDISGNLLDGNGDGVPGDNYVAQFTVALSTSRVLSLPYFARAPGQFVNIPVASSGIPLTISEGSNVVSVSLSVQYNTNLLKVTGAALGSALPAGWALTNNSGSPGIVQLSLGGSVPLSPGTNTIATLTALVPWCASYGSSGILSISSVQLNGGAIPATGDSAVEVAALLGDTDGNGSYTTNDAVIIAQYCVGLLTGFAAYPLVDPEIIGDVLGNGQINLNDATTVVRESYGTLPPGIIPVLPAPSLTMAKATNQALISWPQCANGYVLQQSANLGTQANWTSVTNAPVFIGDQQAIYATPAGTHQFYRLSKVASP